MKLTDFDAGKFFEDLSKISEAIHQQSKFGRADAGSWVAMAAAHYALSAIVTAGRAAMEVKNDG